MVVDISHYISHGTVCSLAAFGVWPECSGHVQLDHSGLVQLKRCSRTELCSLSALAGGGLSAPAIYEMWSECSGHNKAAEALQPHAAGALRLHASGALRW